MRIRRFAKGNVTEVRAREGKPPSNPEVGCARFEIDPKPTATSAAGAGEAAVGACLQQIRRRMPRGERVEHRPRAAEIRGKPADRGRYVAC